MGDPTLNIKSLSIYINKFPIFSKKQCAESAQKSAQFFQFLQRLYQHIFILINAKVSENQKVERFAINRI